MAMPVVWKLVVLAALVAGFALVVAGVWMFSRPAAFIVAGLLVVFAVADLRDVT